MSETTILIILAVVIVLFLTLRKQNPSHLSGNPSNVNYDSTRAAEGYYSRSKMRLEKVLQLTDHLDRAISNDKLDMRLLHSTAGEIRKLADLQMRESVPHPSFEEHKRGYYQIMDLQARKVEDILSTGGENLESLLQEEEELGRQAQARLQDAEEGTSALKRDLGLD